MELNIYNATPPLTAAITSRVRIVVTIFVKAVTLKYNHFCLRVLRSYSNIVFLFYAYGLQNFSMSATIL